jgi:hypothetical protein
LRKLLHSLAEVHVPSGKGDYFHLRMERAIIADPTAIEDPMITPAIVAVVETLVGLKRFPASGLFITKASPILPRPRAIPAVIRTIPIIRKKTADALDLPGIVKTQIQPRLNPRIGSV